MAIDASSTTLAEGVGASHPDDISVAKVYSSTSVEIDVSSRGVFLSSSLLLINCYERLLTHSNIVVIMMAVLFLCQEANTTGPCRGHVTTYAIVFLSRTVTVFSCGFADCCLLICSIAVCPAIAQGGNFFSGRRTNLLSAAEDQSDSQTRQ